MYTPLRFLVYLGARSGLPRIIANCELSYAINKFTNINIYYNKPPNPNPNPTPTHPPTPVILMQTMGHIYRKVAANSTL